MKSVDTNILVYAVNQSTERKSSHIFDRTLAVTLLGNGVTTFHTRNTRDFMEFPFREIINPIDG